MIIFKYIDYALKAKQGYEKPDELLSDLSFGVVEGYFIVLFIILGLITGLSIWAGFFKGIIFFKIVSILFALIFVGLIIVFSLIKKAVARISKGVTDRVRSRFNQNKVVDVEVTEQ